MSERGSRKHILDWTGSPAFRREVGELLSGTGCELDDTALWIPVGHEDPDEAILDSWGPRAAPDMANWSELAEWWLVHRRGANRPNWDLVVACSLGGRPALALFEAKAHEKELERAGKRLDANCSDNARANHDRIGQAIEESRLAYSRPHHEVRISRDCHYQLSNRLAFSWKLADMGVPNVLVYLGFLGDEGIRGVGNPFETEDQWRRAAMAYISEVYPMTLVDVWHSFGRAGTRLILRSREVLSPSPPAIPRA